MTDRKLALLWLKSFVKNKEPMTLIPKQLIRLMYDALKEQPDIVRCKDCKRRGTYSCPVYVGGDGMGSEPDDWFCADGRRE